MESLSMKKSIFSIVSFSIVWVFALFFLSGCAQKAPYSEIPLPSDKTWVYLYSPGTVLVEEMSYDIRVDGLENHLVLNDDGYLIYDVPSDTFTISVRNSDLIDGQLDHKEIILRDLKHGQAYYVKVIVNQGSPVKLKLMDAEKAKQEIKGTVLYDQDANTLKVYESQGKKQSEIVAEPIVDPRAVSASKALSGSLADEIQKLYELQKSGAISEDEFQVLKKKVIDK